ncbi:MAG: ATP-binding protein [Desulfuromusa sp.]|nr:ATP-binding protein [Desulfuromusa sp.]
MQDSNRLRALALFQSSLFFLLLILLLVCEKGNSLIYGGLSFALLICCHLYIEYRLKTEHASSSSRIISYVVLYLLLCTLVVWTTRGGEESPFWIVFFLPIIIAASNLEFRATLITCSAALLLFIGHLPPRMYLHHKERVEEFPELIGFGIMFFMVGILVYNFAQKHRQQLQLKEQLNVKLLENQQNLKESLERLEAAEATLRTKERLASLGEMSAGIAHEIRNPLGIISSSAQLLDREFTSEDDRQLLDIIQEESARLNGLITDFLIFGRQLEPQRQICNLSGLITRDINSLHNVAEQKGVTIEFDCQCDPCEADVDADMIQQVLLNLLLNALAATSSGGKVQVVLRLTANLDIIVSDTGCGIPEENLGKVFDPFFTTKSNGTGLGLANAYKIIESHGGDLSVESQLGKGSTFTVSLPLEGV